MSLRNINDLIRRASEKYLSGASLNPPVNTALPTISGTAQVGQVLTATTGSWTNSPTSYSYQFKADGVNISGATGASYTPVVGDVGKKISVTVTASNTDGSGSATSSETSEVVAGGTSKTYADFVTHITALASGEFAWTSIAIGSSTGRFTTNAQAGGALLSGTSWMAQFRGNNSYMAGVVRHGMPSEAAIKEQIINGRTVMVNIERTTYALTPGLNRNGYQSLDNRSSSTPCVLTELLFYDEENGPMRMQPHLGLGPEPYDW